MRDATKKFFELLSKDKDLAQKVCRMTELTEIIDLAKELGIELTEADFEATEGELSENELNAVAGGGGCVCILSGGGGGTDANNDKKYGCACKGYGQGGDGRLNDFNCVCVVGGDGTDDGWNYE